MAEMKKTQDQIPVPSKIRIITYSSMYVALSTSPLGHVTEWASG